MTAEKQYTLITRSEWEHLKKEFPRTLTEGDTPEECGFMLYYSAEQLELLQNLKRRWK